LRQHSSTNSIQKVCRILKILSTPQPLRLTDISEASGVNKATAMRLLETLIEEGFVERDERKKVYSLGEESATLGIAMYGRNHIRHRARSALLRLADISGDTVLLSTRSGCEVVCIDREFGNFPIRANYLDIGMRRPLGIGAGALAVLAWLPDEEVDSILELNKPFLSRNYPRISPSLIKDAVHESREKGFAMLLNVVVDQMGGIALPIIGMDGRPYAALSIAALTHRIESRQEMLVAAIKKEAQQLSGSKSQID
jgi:DNA-binding IclR family transcriptional regulator